MVLLFSLLRHHAKPLVVLLWHQGKKMEHLVSFFSKKSALQQLQRETIKRYACPVLFFFRLGQFLDSLSCASLLCSNTNELCDGNKWLELFGVKALFPLSVCISSFTIQWMWKNNYGESSSVWEILIRAMKLSRPATGCDSMTRHWDHSSAGTLPTQKGKYNKQVATYNLCLFSAVKCSGVNKSFGSDLAI